MERIKALNRYQKFILAISAVMAVFFAVTYAVVISRVGYDFKGKILVPENRANATVYSGKSNGQNIEITVTPDKTVTFEYEEKTYGPYTVFNDPTAIPTKEDTIKGMTGVEIRKGDEIFFRGGFYRFQGADFDLWIESEDGSYNNIDISFVTGDGVRHDANGNPVDEMAPSVRTIIDLTHNPRLTHKGDWSVWVGCTFILLINMISILFADEIFRWNLQFRVKDVNSVRPSEWEMAGRYFGWTMLPIIAICFYIAGVSLR